ncbi:hypothetical protein A9Q98_08560 [Thalassotalea sp. 42_200_T64]|nr:hypothetical protein A9Q98_08560 [Thalassotalea sp. 42_200_T64]
MNAIAQVKQLAQQINNIAALQEQLISKAEVQKLKRSTIYNYLIRLMIVTLLLSLLTVGAFYLIKQQKTQHLSASVENNIDAIDALIHNNINFLENQVHIFAADPELHRYIITNSEISKQFIANSWQTIAERLHWFAKIEYLPLFGNNNISVQYDQINNEAFIDENSEGQKSLFSSQQVIHSNSEQLHLSEIDLNKEFNEPTYPLTPILTITNKIDLGSKKSEGLLKVNVYADKLLQPINQIMENPIGRTVLLSSSGYYLKADKDEQEWGQSIHSRKHFNFAEQLPAEWQQIKQQQHGQITTSNGTFNFRVLSFNHANEEQFIYYLVNQITAEHIYDSLVEQIIQVMVFGFALLLFSIAGLWLSFKNQLNQKIQSYSQSLINVLFNSDDAIFTADSNWQIISMNDVFKKITGYQTDDILNKPISCLFADEISKESFSVIRNEISTNGFWRGELTVNSKNKRQVPCSFSVASVNEMNSDTSHYVMHIIDISEQKKIEDELKLAAIALESNSGILISASNGNILRVNSAFSRITGYQAKDVIGQNPRILSSNTHSKEFYQQLWDAINIKGCWEGEIWNKRKNGDIYPQWTNISKITDANESQYFVATFEDITIRKELEEKLRSLASSDPLTSCLNRRSFENQVKQQLSLVQRHQQNLALILFDIDHFKAVNDNFGHDKGDEILVAIANTARNTLRSSDIIARWGGEEFLVLLPSNDIHGAMQTAERLRRAFQAMSTSPQVTCSFGVTAFTNGDELNTMVKRADIALYQAKDSGRNKVVQAEELTLTQ